jgi:ribosome-associated protein
MTVATKSASKAAPKTKRTTTGKAVIIKPSATRTAKASTIKRVTKPNKVTPTQIEDSSASAALAKVIGKSPKGTKRPRKTTPVEQNETQTHARLAARYTLEKKAENVRILDLRQVTTMTDFFVIASADSDKQVKAIAENVIAEMRDTEGVAPWHSEGWDTLRWVIVDFVDFVVHVFQKEARVLYNLERLWADAPVEEIKDEPVKKVTRAKRVKNEDAPVRTESEPKPIIRVIRDEA